MAVLGYSSGIANTNITTIGEVQTVGFNLSSDTADTTSTLSKFAKSVPTTISSNTIFISLYYDGQTNGEADKFVDEFKLKRVSLWTITFSDGGEFSCTGYVSRVTVAAAEEAVIRMDITINLVGEPEFN